MTFKKDGADPTLSRVVSLPGLPGGPSFSAWLDQAAQAVRDFVQAATEPPAGKPYDEFRTYRGRRPAKRRGGRKLHRNMLHVSRRARHKHRLARKAA